MEADSEVNQVENGVKNLGLHSTSGKTVFFVIQGHWALKNMYLECSQSVLNFFILKYIQESTICFLFTSRVEYPICMTICIRDKIHKRRLGLDTKNDWFRLHYSLVYWCVQKAYLNTFASQYWIPIHLPYFFPIIHLFVLL